MIHGLTNSLARVYRQVGDLEKAIASCRKSLELRPDVGDISQLLERLLEEQKRKDAALTISAMPPVSIEFFERFVR